MGRRGFQGGGACPGLLRGLRYVPSSIRSSQGLSTHPQHSGVEIVSIAQNEISHTYTFDAPAPASISSPTNPANLKMRRQMSLVGTRKASFGSSSRMPSFLSRTSSIASDESDYSSTSSDDLSSSESTSNGHGLPTHTLHHDRVCMRDALTYSREQLLNGSEMKKAGGNVLFCEGSVSLSLPLFATPFYFADRDSFDRWQVTRLRKNNQYRIQVRYFGRPARAVFAAPASRAQLVPSSGPPFMDLLGDAWY